MKLVRAQKMLRAHAEQLTMSNGSEEEVIMQRLSQNGALMIGHDDIVAIAAGDTWSILRDNIGWTGENVILASEAGFTSYAFPNNDTAWSNRNTFRFYGGDATAGNNGLYIGDGSNTQFIDLDRNLKNIGTITATGDFNLTNGFYLAHNDGMRLSETGNASTSQTTLTSYTFGGNSAMKVKGGNFIHNVYFETSWNNFQYARLNSSYSGNDSNFYLYKSDSSGNTAATTTISTGTSTFAGDVTIGPKNNATVQVSESGGATVKMLAGSVGRIGTYSDHDFIITQNSNDAITIDSSRNATFAADVKADTHFTSSDTNVTLSTSSNGTVFLRPNGKSSTTSQSTFTNALASIGTNATFAGNVIVGATLEGDSFTNRFRKKRFKL